ncbi:hypothetical protein [Pukyongiella litopenaei]|uniref:Uncharacterized protein n=1 Tax=Pukyongiella litopenaei TaxID=2605946 RepID=A0A2S0MV15_9RHOB|nr:hypothetical protein [Pukyongiella litopenaei]AVO39702.1 hypothetical protein C6Y53_07720 [Pukyongiella litopenaei]
MPRISVLFAAVMLLLVPAAGPVAAQQVVGSYIAYIGEDDLFNSKGVRLDAPWQVLRQDRANYHRFGIRQFGDEGDGFFADAGNRAKMERMLMNGRMDPAAARLILRGGAMVLVTLYGSGARADYIEVTVAR